jgi:hypothetical protein
VKIGLKCYYLGEITQKYTKMDENTPIPQTLEHEALKSRLVMQYKDSIAFSKGLWSKRIKNLECYMGVVPKKRYKSEANFNVPYAATLLDNVWPLLTNKLPFAETVARNVERDGDAAKLMQELVRFTFEMENFEEKFLMAQKESMLMANAWAYVCWKYGQDVNHPSIKILNTMDVRIHRSKVELDDRWPIFVREELTRQQMIERGWDEQSIMALGKSKLEDSQYRKSQLAAMGLSPRYTQGSTSEIDPLTDVFEVVTSWFKMKFPEGTDEEVACVVIANDERIINTTQNGQPNDFRSPYPEDKNMYPLAMLPFNPLPHTLYAESFIDPIYDMWVELCALENMKADNYKRRNNPPLKVVRTANIDLDSLQFIAGLPWLVDADSDITPFDIPDLSQSIANQQQMVKEMMQARTGANDVLLVSDANAIKGGDTAMGASIANENTKMRFKPQALLIDKFVQRIGQLVINRWQSPTFFDVQRIISITGPDGQMYQQTIMPGQVNGELQFMVKSNTSLAESASAQLQKYIQLKNIYMNDQNPNMQEELDRAIFTSAGLDYNKFKPNQAQDMSQLSITLEKLMATASDPRFKSLPPAQQKEILMQIQDIKNTLQSLGGQAPVGGNNAAMNDMAQNAPQASSGPTQQMQTSQPTQTSQPSQLGQTANPIH